jgi:Mrp family chromosome partitioning ATPase
VEHASVIQGPDGWRPVAVPLPAELAVAGGSLSIMSIAYLLPSANDAVVWRGPRKDAMIKQFISDVMWGQLDYLVVDTPPGTSDEHMTLCEAIRPMNATGAVVVTTPQLVSTDDVRKELSFCHKLSLRCLGIVENMSGYICPHCSECTAIFSKGGGEKLAALYEVPFLGAVPLDPTVSLAEDEGRSVFAVSPPGPAVAAISAVIENILQQVARVEALRNGGGAPQRDSSGEEGHSGRQGTNKN